MTSLVHKHKRTWDYFLGLLLATLIVAPMFDGVIPALSYVDELSAILLVVLGVLRKDRTLFSREDKGALAALGCVLIVGILGNLLWGYQQNAFAIAVDIFTCFKFVAAYYGAFQLIHNSTDIRRIAGLVCKLFIGVAIAGLPLHLFGVIQMGSDRQILGIYCYQFLYSHTSELAAFCVGSVALFMNEAKKNRVWIILASILILMTMRAKAIAVAFVIVFFFVRDLISKGRNTVSLLECVSIGVGVVLLGINQVQYYFEDTGSARYLMQAVSMQIAATHFPLGAGFATFASYMSGVYYSPLYYEYGLSNVWGLTPNSPAFVSDGFWPNIIGQFGYLGLLLFVLGMVLFFKSYITNCKKRFVVPGSYLIIPVYFLILSTSDAAFFNFYSVFYAAIMAILSSAENYSLVAGTNTDKRGI